MNNHSSPTPYSWSYVLVGLALSAGFILSVLSWLEVCVEHCAANQDYRLFGLPFAIFGIAFFIGLIALHLLSGWFPALKTCVGWLIASALGAEMMFIAVQKYQIGHWCPVCLSIAACVVFAALVFLVGYAKNFIQQHQRGSIMQKIKQAFTSLSFFIVGFLMAFIGVSNPNSAEAVSKEMQEKIAFGLRESPVEIYFVTDWFCPSCKKIEPFIEKLYPKLREKGTFYFIDYPIHKKSMNFSPYNMAFLLNNKDQYFKARKLLMDLSSTNDSPKDEDIAKAATAVGIQYKEIPYLDVKAGMDYFDSIVQKYNLNSTPTLILTNPTHHKMIKLEGLEEIKEDKIWDALDKVSKKI